MTIRHLMVIVLCCSAFSCSSYTPEPAVWVDDDVSYDKYQFIEVLPVTSITEEPVSQEILEGIRQRIIVGLRNKGYIVSEERSGQGSAQDVLQVKNEIIYYRTGSRVKGYLSVGAFGRTDITIRTSLLDKEDQEELSDMLTKARDVPVSTLFNIMFQGNKVDPREDDVIDAIIKEIDRQIKGRRKLDD